MSHQAGRHTWLHRSLMAAKQLPSSRPTLSSPMPLKAATSAVLTAASVVVRRHAGGLLSAGPGNSPKAVLHLIQGREHLLSQQQIISYTVRLSCDSFAARYLMPLACFPLNLQGALLSTAH